MSDLSPPVEIQPQLARTFDMRSFSLDLVLTGSTGWGGFHRVVAWRQLGEEQRAFRFGGKNGLIVRIQNVHPDRR